MSKKRIWVSSEVYGMLEAFAKKANKSVDQLANKLLEIDIKDLYIRARTWMTTENREKHVLYTILDSLNFP